MLSVVVYLWNDAPSVRTTADRGLPKPPPARVVGIDNYKLLERKRALMERYPNRPEIRQQYEQLLRSQRPAGGPTIKETPAREFLPQHVNVVQRMFARWLKQPHRFVCVADSGEGLDEGVQWVETPAAARQLRKLGSPEGERFPSCYCRLWSFSAEAKALLGERILCLDIDHVLTGPMDPVVDRDEDFVGWRPFRDWGRRLRFGGGQYLLRTGSRTHVWERFKGVDSIVAARAAGFRGSDQAWISYCLAEREPYWDTNSGLYSVRDLGASLDLPADARLVQFNGRDKPWQVARRGTPPWVLAHWR